VLKPLLGKEAACDHSCCRCSSERWAWLVQKSCLVRSSCWKTGLLLSNMVEAMVGWMCLVELVL
jgi:hypothetical protein